MQSHCPAPIAAHDAVHSPLHVGVYLEAKALTLSRPSTEELSATDRGCSEVSGFNSSNTTGGEGGLNATVMPLPLTTLLLLLVPLSRWGCIHHTGGLYLSLPAAAALLCGPGLGPSLGPSSFSRRSLHLLQHALLQIHHAAEGGRKVLGSCVRVDAGEVVGCGYGYGVGGGRGGGVWAGADGIPGGGIDQEQPCLCRRKKAGNIKCWEQRKWRKHENWRREWTQGTGTPKIITLLPCSITLLTVNAHSPVILKQSAESPMIILPSFCYHFPAISATILRCWSDLLSQPRGGGSRREVERVEQAPAVDGDATDVQELEAGEGRGAGAGSKGDVEAP